MQDNQKYIDSYYLLQHNSNNAAPSFKTTILFTAFVLLPQNTIYSLKSTNKNIYWIIYYRSITHNAIVEWDFSSPFAILSFSLSEHELKDNLFIFGIKKAFLFDYFYATSVEIDTLFFFYFHIKPSFHLKVIIWNQFTLDFDWMAFLLYILLKSWEFSIWNSFLLLVELCEWQNLLMDTHGQMKNGYKVKEMELNFLFFDKALQFCYFSHLLKSNPQDRWESNETVNEMKGNGMKFFTKNKFFIPFCLSFFIFNFTSSCSCLCIFGIWGKI